MYNRKIVRQFGYLPELYLVVISLYSFEV